MKIQEIAEKNHGVRARRLSGLVPRLRPGSGIHDWRLEGHGEDLETAPVENEKRDCHECLPWLISL